MPRRARIVIPGEAHHVTQRGNNRQYVFNRPEDFSVYCFWMNKYKAEYGVDVLAYCLMSNHVHFIVVPKDKFSLARLFNTVHMRFAQYKHNQKKSCGHLWQGRFFSCVMDDDHLFKAIRYVEQNPVRARLVRLPWEYPWSSARWHMKMPRKDYIQVTDTKLVDKKFWRQYLLGGEEGWEEKIRTATRMGGAVANKDFVEYWESRLGCVLRELRPGRKKNSGK